MARQIIFHKYQGRENGFLIYDIRKNEGEMDDKMLHMIQSRNFGMDLDGILVGPYLINGSLQMRLYDGKEKKTETFRQLIWKKQDMLPETIPGTDSGRKRSIAGVRKCLKNDFCKL